MGLGGAQPVSKIVTKVIKHWKLQKRPAAFPESLSQSLDRVCDVLRAAGATAANKDCGTLLKLFVGEPCADTQLFCTELAAAVQAPPPVPKSKSQPVDSTHLRGLADKLEAVRTDNDRFDAAFSELQSNTKLKKGDLEVIAKEFLGYKRKFKSKAEVLETIKNRQVQDAIQASRERRIEKIAI